MNLKPRTTHGAVINQDDDTYSLQIPAGPQGTYRWAQLDDYLDQSRKEFPWKPPLRLSLEARITNPAHPGTWGFGFWNDPFSTTLRIGGTRRELPALPNCVWFFHASPPNYLSFRNDRPAQGFLTAAFSAPLLPAPLLAFALPAAPLLFWRSAARLLRRFISRIIHEDSHRLDINTAAWQQYTLEWTEHTVLFWVNQEPVFQTQITPRGNLGLVIWIDNQYAAFSPDGRLGMGTLQNDLPAALLIRDLKIKKGGS